MAAESNCRFQSINAAAGNAVRTLEPPAPAGTTVAECLRSVPPWVLEVATYCIHLGAASALVTAQLRLGEDLTGLHPRFLPETSDNVRPNLVRGFFDVGNGVLAGVNVEDIIRNASRE
jgi:hypothetical protein